MNQSPQRIIDMANAYFESCVLFSACDSGIFSFIAQNGPCEAADIAAKLQFDSAALTKLADACVALGLLDKSTGSYGLTNESRTFLVPGQGADLSGALRYNRDVYGAWGKLSQFLRTGKPVERPEIHLGDNKQRTRDFVMAMHFRALGIGRVVVPLLDLSSAKRLLDVGGGPGTFSVLIAQANPQIICSVIDLPPIAEIAAGLVAQQGMKDRVSVEGRDYHRCDFPANQDAVLFFGVLHQESPPSIVDLFKRAYRALNPGGSVYVMDVMTDEAHTAPKFSTFFSINMALTTENGWVFSDAELKGWLEEAEFTRFSVKPVGGSMPHWLAKADKV
jgi:ubiquinone/menaquinone biosynthesis C-methylase UbiE